jgi:hypothetical protein
VAEKFCHKSSKTQSFTKNLLQIQPSAIFIIVKFKQSLNQPTHVSKKQKAASRFAAAFLRS